MSAVVPARGSTAAWSPWPRRRRTIRRALVIGLLIAGGILMMVPFLWMISTSLKTRAEVFAIPQVLFPANPRFENYGEMWNALPFAAFFVNSVKLAALNTIGTAAQLLDGGVRIRRAALPVPRPALRIAARHADHPVPGRADPELHPVPAVAAPVQHERQLDRDAGAVVGRRLPRRRVRDVPAQTVLPDDPPGAGRCGARRRREPVADLSAHLPAPRETGARDARDLHVHVVVERLHQPDHLPA